MNARDMERIERRRRGEPTLPLECELVGLTEDERAERISAAAAIEAAWWRGDDDVAQRDADRRRRRLLTKRGRAEAIAQGAARAAGRELERHQCPWCSRACLPNAPGCAEHDELERGFLQAAGDGWG